MTDKTAPDLGNEVVDPAADAAAALAAAGKTADKLEDETETPEEKAAREKEEADAAAKPRIRIPKERFDEAIAKERRKQDELVARINELERGTATAKAVTDVGKLKGELEAAKDKYEDLVMEGKKDEARAQRKVVDRLQETVQEAVIASRSEATRAATIDSVKYDNALAKYEGMYPELDADGDKFDEEKAGEVVTLIKAFRAAGATAVDSLHKAVRYVFGTPAAKDPTAPDAAAEAKKKRDEEARRKAAEAAGKQPPNITKVGENSNREGGDKSVDIMRVSQDEFKKIDESVLAKIRGDEV